MIAGRILAALLGLALLAAPAAAQHRIGPLQADNNLSDLDNPAAALANLGALPASTVPSSCLLGGTGSALSAVTISSPITCSGGVLGAIFGTTAGTIAQGNDSRIVGAAQTANNLSDLVSPATALVNLGGASLSATNSFTGQNSFSYPNNYFGGAAVLGEAINLQSAASNIAQIQLYYGNTLGWQIQSSTSGQATDARNAPLIVSSRSDAGTYNGLLFEGLRESGTVGTGGPYFGRLAPWFMAANRDTSPNDSYGIEINGVSDQQSVLSLPGATPYYITNGSKTLYVFLANCCVSGGPMDITRGDVWVKLHGAALLGGSTNVDVEGQGLHPGSTGPYYQVKTIVNSGEFTVQMNDNAAGTSGSGGGTGSTAQPFAADALELWYTTAYSGAGGYANQADHNYACAPYFYQNIGSGYVLDCEMNYDEFYSPPETGNYSFHAIQRETDIVNLSGDRGNPGGNFFSGTPSNVVGTWFVPYAGNPVRLAQLGGTASNVTAAITVTASSQSSTNTRLGWYYGFNCQPDSMVGTAADTVTHIGGACFDTWGSQAYVNPNGFTTSSGSAVVTVSLLGNPANLTGHVNGDTVYIPGAYSFDGVSFGAGDYPISNVNVTAQTFTIVGSGSGLTGVSAGGSGQVIFFDREDAEAPLAMHGGFTHGIYVDPFTLFQDGFALRSIPKNGNNPGGGVGWCDGTGCAGVSGTEVSAGVIDVTLTPASAGRIVAKGPLATQSYTIASGANQIPSCSSALKGTTVYVTDFSGSPSFNGSIGAGGGSTNLPAFCNGSAWSIH